MGMMIHPRDTGTVSEKRKAEEATEHMKRTYIVIKTGLLIPGADEPIEDAALVIDGKLIAWVGAQADLPEKYSSAALRIYEVPYLMPGLWDCHAHFGGESEDQEVEDHYLAFVAEHPASAGARLARQCWESIQRGYTSLRDVGGLGCELSKAVDDGTIIGPNIYGAGAVLSQTAGHGDVFSMPAGDVLSNLGVTSLHSGHLSSNVCVLADGVDECRKAVRLQIRRGAKCIKFCASGGVTSRDDDVQRAQFSDEEMVTIMTEAARQGRSVAAHAHAKPGIIAAIKAGVKTIEHGSFADQECVDLMKEKNVIFVPTRFVVEALIESGGKGLTRESWEKAKLCAKSHLSAYKAALAAGVTIAFGTDTSPGFNMAIEIELAVKSGMSNLEAIKAATANGPLTVGEMAPKTGQLKEGYEADLIGVLENPVENVKVLQKKGNIGWVWKGGRIFKGPGVGPWGESSSSSDD
jgi:imidazolonepropionase-like amidohydrolase